MGKALIGAIVAGLVVFVWGAASHMLLPIGEAGMAVAADEDEVLAAMKDNMFEPAMYMVPGMLMSDEPTEAEQEAWQAKYDAGPFGLVVYHPGGGDSFPLRLAKQAATDIVAALVAAILLSMTSVGYGKRVVFVTLMGVFGWLVVNVPYWTWYGFPADFTVGALIDTAAGWFLGGLVLAKFVAPSP